MDVVLILNDGPSAGGRSDTAFRLAMALLRAEDAAVRVFLVGDAVQCAAGVRTTAAGGLGDAVTTLISAGGVVAVSDAAMREQALAPGDLVIGAEPTAFATLAAWCLASDRILVF
jgi:sulfur relay (sulfurtransferase) complex TusBCD TusD component (DsrE family)